MPTAPGIHLWLSVAYWHQGMWKEWEAELERRLQLSGDGEVAHAVHRAFERGGEKAVEQWRVQQLKVQARKEYVSPFTIASQYAFLGDKNGTLKYLEQAYSIRDPWLIMLQTEPVFDFLHSEPRYQNLIRNMGLPQHS